LDLETELVEAKKNKVFGSKKTSVIDSRQGYSR